MEKMMAFCGVNCHECPTFLATKANDDEKRAEVAQLWSKEFGANIKPEDINCNGCVSDSGVLFGHCQTCEIRKCALEKETENCAHCSDYSCEKLNTVLDTTPDAKKRLDEIRAAI
jgi:Protein of unknown function (DUF3795)